MQQRRESSHVRLADGLAGEDGALAHSTNAQRAPGKGLLWTVLPPCPAEELVARPTDVFSAGLGVVRQGRGRRKRNQRPYKEHICRESGGGQAGEDQCSLVSSEKGPRGSQSRGAEPPVLPVHRTRKAHEEMRGRTSEPMGH